MSEPWSKAKKPWRVELQDYLDEEHFSSVTVTAKLPTDYVRMIMTIAGNDGKEFDRLLVKALFNGASDIIKEFLILKEAHHG